MNKDDIAKAKANLEGRMSVSTEELLRSIAAIEASHLADNLKSGMVDYKPEIVEKNLDVLKRSSEITASMLFHLMEENKIAPITNLALFTTLININLCLLFSVSDAAGLAILIQVADKFKEDAQNMMMLRTFDQQYTLENYLKKDTPEFRKGFYKTGM